MKIKEQDKLLLRLLFSEESYTEEQLSLLLKGLDIDREKKEYLLMLALLGNKNRWRYFPDTVRPRVEGIYRATRANNIYGMPWLKEQIKFLDTADIPVMLLKGMAIRCHYVPGIAREMSDFDLAVPEDLFEKAKETLLPKGERINFGGITLHAESITGPQRSIDLHRWVFKCGGKSAEAIWSRAIPTLFQGQKVYVPDPVDMVVHLLDNKARDSMLDIHSGRRLMWIYDIRAIVEKEEINDWQVVAERAAEYGVSYYCKLLLPIFSDVFPEILPKEELNRCFPMERKDKERSAQISNYKKAYLKYANYRTSHSDKTDIIMHCVQAVRHTWANYKWYSGPELKEQGEHVSFRRFVCLTYHTNSIWSLILRVFSKQS